MAKEELARRRRLAIEEELSKLDPHLLGELEKVVKRIKAVDRKLDELAAEREKLLERERWLTRLIAGKDEQAKDVVERGFLEFYLDFHE